MTKSFIYAVDYKQINDILFNPRSDISSAMAARLVPYTPVQRMQGYDLRLLKPHPVASITYQRRDEGFLALGSYLSGANAENRKCIETQPVLMTHDPCSGTKHMQVYVVPEAVGEGGLEKAGPSREDGEGETLNVPAPLNKDIVIEVAGGELIAALRFEGNATKERADMARQQLLALLQKGRHRVT